MSNMTASFSLQFNDSFSNTLRSSLLKARGTVDSFVKKLDEIKSARGLISTVENLNRVSVYTQGTVQQFGLVASVFESSMESVRSSLLASVRTGKVMEAQYNTMSNSVSTWVKAQSAAAFEYANTAHQMLGAGLRVHKVMEATSVALSSTKDSMEYALKSGSLFANMYNDIGSKGESVSQAISRISDVILNTQGIIQRTNLSKLGEGLKYIVTTAKPVRARLEQIYTIIESLNTMELPGGQIGNQIGSTAASMLRNSLNIAGDTLGTQITYDNEGFNFMSTLEHINKKLAPLSIWITEQGRALQHTFGNVGVRAINLLGGALENLGAKYLNINQFQDQAVSMAKTLGRSMLTRGSDFLKEQGAKIFSPLQSNKVVPTAQIKNTLSRGDDLQKQNVTINIDQISIPKPNDIQDFMRLVYEFFAEVQGA